MWLYTVDILMLLQLKFDFSIFNQGGSSVICVDKPNTNGKLLGTPRPNRYKWICLLFFYKWRSTE